VKVLPRDAIKSRCRSSPMASTMQMFAAHRTGTPQLCEHGGGAFSHLPGDPAVVLFTNVSLGDKKMEFMKSLSKAIEASTGKPESYIAVCVHVCFFSACLVRLMGFAPVRATVACSASMNDQDSHPVGQVIAL
jgi:hypothetical protein